MGIEHITRLVCDHPECFATIEVESYAEMVNYPHPGGWNESPNVTFSRPGGWQCELGEYTVFCPQHKVEGKTKLP
jgi:hypothetical protein